jgi:hypothetical protein
MALLGLFEAPRGQLRPRDRRAAEGNGLQTADPSDAALGAPVAQRHRAGDERPGLPAPRRSPRSRKTPSGPAQTARSPAAAHAARRTPAPRNARRWSFGTPLSLEAHQRLHNGAQWARRTKTAGDRRAATRWLAAALRSARKDCDVTKRNPAVIACLWRSISLSPPYPAKRPARVQAATRRCFASSSFRGVEGRRSYQVGEEVVAAEVQHVDSLDRRDRL